MDLKKMLQMMEEQTQKTPIYSTEELLVQLDSFNHELKAPFPFKVGDIVVQKKNGDKYKYKYPNGPAVIIKVFDEKYSRRKEAGDRFGIEDCLIATVDSTDGEQMLWSMDSRFLKLYDPAEILDLNDFKNPKDE